MREGADGERKAQVPASSWKTDSGLSKREARADFERDHKGFAGKRGQRNRQDQDPENSTNDFGLRWVCIGLERRNH